MRSGWTGRALAGALMATALFPAWVLATEGSDVVGRESGTEMLVEHLERVEVGSEEAVVVFDVDGSEQEVTVEYEDTLREIEGKLTDDETDVVDLAAIPVVGGAMLKLAGFLLRLGRA